MWLTVDFNSDEAIYMQLYYQIIEGIATDRLREGESLPSVRQLADNIGINMHTVNKAYAVLRQEGYITLDRRRGAVIALDLDKMAAAEVMRRDLKRIIARAKCHDITRAEIHGIVDSVINELDDVR